MLNLEEIKAREQAATPGPWPRNGSIFAANGINNADFIAHAIEDIPALIAEVERLTAKNNALESDKINAEMNLENLTAEVEGLDAENTTLKKQAKMWKAIAIAQKDDNATLKKALELMKKYLSDNRIGIDVDSFIQQAEQLTHETHEVDK